MPTPSGPTHEIRLGVVMYGGVSLAVYMSGVARELFELVHASRCAASHSTEPPSVPDPVAVVPVVGTSNPALASVYRDALAAMDAAQGREPGASRVSVDVIVGASAGGINGVYLAKALAAAAPTSVFDTLRDLWFEEASIPALIDGLGPRPRVRALFDGTFMYTRLKQALDAVDAAAGAGPRTRLVDQLGLVVTATDLGGAPVRMRLADRVVKERDHKHAFEFRLDRDEFGPEANPLLAFAARTTSSFPIAFAPTRVRDVDEPRVGEGPHAEHGRREAPDPTRAGPRPAWWRLFRRQPDPAAPAHEERVFSDGGYLDNKPFGHAIDQLAASPADAGVTRKLLYIEPTPELDVRADAIEPPNALANAASAFTLARYETIRDDLARLAERNRLIERVRTLTAGLEEETARLCRRLRPVGRERRYAERSLDELVRRSGLGPAYGAYHRLRVATTTDDLTDLVADHAGVAPESDHRLAIRLALQRRRAARFERNPAPGSQARPESAFLQAFDVAFRVRRARFVLEKLDQLAQLTPATPVLLEHYRTMAAFAEIDAVLRGFQEGPAGALAARRAWLPVADALAGARDRIRAALDELLAGLASIQAWGAEGHASERAAELPAALATELDAVLRAQADGTSETPSTSAALERRLETAETLVRERLEAHDAAFEAALVSLTPRSAPALVKKAGELARRFYAEGFELYDAIEFPLLEAAGLEGERAPVEVYRVSPADATLLSHPATTRSHALDDKLFGSRLGSFGAFFDRRWRQNDLLWGRLDGAERLIASLLPGEANAERRRDLGLRAARAIVCQELPDLDAAEVAELDAGDLLAAIRRAYPRDHAPAAASVARDTARLARTAIALVRDLQPSLVGTTALLRSVSALLVLLLWALDARPWAFLALVALMLALFAAVASAGQLTLVGVIASAVALLALLGAAGAIVAWAFRRRLLSWLAAQLVRAKA